MTPLRTANLLRTLFVILAVSLGALVGDRLTGNAALGAAMGGVLGLLTVLIDRLLHGVSLRAFSSATIGLLLGLIMVQILRASDALRFLPEQTEWTISLILFAVCGYIGMMLAIRSSRDEFSIIIPYVRFTRESVHDAPLLVDTNIIIDGRLESLTATGFLSRSIVVPDFVIDELQKLADSAEPLKRERGRRGLDSVAEMRQSRTMEVSIYQSDMPATLTVDARLLQVARIAQVRLLTNDSNLCKVARIQGITVLNINELAGAMRPQLHPGELLELPLVREGRDPHQAVGYLPDGTMVVVNNARDHIGHTRSAQISSTVQTNAGRIFFAELK